MNSNAAPHKAVFLDRDGVIVIPQFGDGRSYAPRTMLWLVRSPVGRQFFTPHMPGELSFVRCGLLCAA